MFLGELLLYGRVILPPKIDIDVAGLSSADLKQHGALPQSRIKLAIHVGKVVRMLRRRHSAALVGSDLPDHIRHVGERYERLLVGPFAFC